VTTAKRLYGLRGPHEAFHLPFEELDARERKSFSPKFPGCPE